MTVDELVQHIEKAISLTDIDPRDCEALEEYLHKARTMKLEELLEDQERGSDGREIHNA